MYLNRMQFLTQSMDWKVINVYNHYMFEQENFKKKFVLGNQRARQEVVAKNNDVQTNFY